MTGKRKGKPPKRGSNIALYTHPHHRPHALDSSRLAVLEVITRHETRSSTVPAHNLRLPPPVVLQAQDSEDVAFTEGQFFGDGGLVHVHSAS
jgi:hypothetical protein